MSLKICNTDSLGSLVSGLNRVQGEVTDTIPPTAQVQLREQRCRFSLQEPEMCLSCKSGGASSAVLPRSVSKARVCPVQEERQSWFQSGLVICQD